MIITTKTAFQSRAAYSQYLKDYQYEFKLEENEYGEGYVLEDPFNQPTGFTSINVINNGDSTITIKNTFVPFEWLSENNLKFQQRGWYDWVLYPKR